jgi:hypothetical protein
MRDHGGTVKGKNEHAGLVSQNSEFDHHHLLKQWFDWTLKVGGPKPEFLQNKVAYYLMGAEHWKYADGLDSIETYCKLVVRSSPGPALAQTEAELELSPARAMQSGELHCPGDFFLMKFYQSCYTIQYAFGCKILITQSMAPTTH